MRGKKGIALALVLGVASGVACSLPIPDVELPPVAPVLEVGSMEEYAEEIPLGDVTEARVDIRLGIGEIELEAGEADPFFSGDFRTNVAEWAPVMTWQDGSLRVEQEVSSGMAGEGAENEWQLRFSPSVEMEMDIEVGAAQGTLDFTGLALTDLNVESGVSELTVRFDEPNGAAMDSLTVQTGAADLRVEGIGNAGPAHAVVRGGVGNLFLDFSGAWPASASVDIEAGLGALTVRVPGDVGVRIEVEGGLGSVTVGDGLDALDGAYVNAAYGEADIQLDISIRMGFGSAWLGLASE